MIVRLFPDNAAIIHIVVEIPVSQSLAVFNVYSTSSSSSFELFVVSFMQEDVYIGYTALGLTFGLQVYS